MLFGALGLALGIAGTTAYDNREYGSVIRCYTVGKGRGSMTGPKHSDGNLGLRHEAEGLGSRGVAWGWRCCICGCGNGIRRITHKQTRRKVSLTAISREEKAFRGGGAE